MAALSETGLTKTNAAHLLDEESLTSTFAPSMEAYAHGRNFRLGPRPADERREAP
jgi:hypothetical protein